MSTDLAAGTILTVQVQATPQSEYNPDPQSDVTQVLGVLSGYGFTSAGAPVVTLPGFVNQAEGDYVYNVTLYLQCQTGNDTDDATAIISEAFQDYSGYPVSSVAITNIQAPAPATGLAAPGSSTATGLPGNSTNTSPGATMAPDSFSNAISSFFSGLEAGGTALIVGIIAIVILVLILAAYSPNAKGLASAAAASAAL